MKTILLSTIAVLGMFAFTLSPALADRGDAPEMIGATDQDGVTNKASYPNPAIDQQFAGDGSRTDNYQLPNSQS